MHFITLYICKMTPKYFFYFFVLCLSIDFGRGFFIVPSASTNGYFAIRSKTSGFALDATQVHPALSFYSGLNTQLWKFQTAGGPDVYNIVSHNNIWNNYALDVDANNYIVLAKRDANKLNQKWALNYDGTLYNVGTLGFLSNLDANQQQDMAGDVLQTKAEPDTALKFILEQK